MAESYFPCGDVERVTQDRQRTRYWTNNHEKATHQRLFQMDHLSL